MEKELMRTDNMKLETLERLTVRLACGFACIAVLVLLLSMLLLGFAGTSFAQELQSKKFASPAEASNALFEAAKKQDEQALEAILGAGKEVTSSSDEVQDKLEREHFCQKYQEMHRLVRERDGTTVLYIGAENWPFPIPLVSKGATWHFDSDTGKQEILFRRVGENEATAVQICEEFALTKKEQEESALTKKDQETKATSEDPVTRFAESLFASGEPNAASDAPALFHGYYFRTVSGSLANGANNYAPVGTKEGGLFLVAYPAEYGSSGVMTFVVTWRGVVFEKDLGPITTKVASGLKRLDSSWQVAE
jgi:hypothetical protein